DLFAEYFGSEIDCIIGSSMGGFAGFYLSMMFETPALLFNPALPYRSVRQKVPKYDYNICRSIEVVLGERDNLILAADTEKFLHKHYPNNIFIRTRRLTQLEHRIPLSVFEEEVKRFRKMV